jgi:hypothetical protein
MEPTPSYNHPDSHVAGGDPSTILFGMTLRQGDVADAVAAVFGAVPLHEARRPFRVASRSTKPLIRNSSRCSALSV